LGTTEDIDAMGREVRYIASRRRRRSPMRGKLLFLGGLAAGFVLGARAGRERYEELVVAARKVRDNPTMQEAAGVVQEQANRLVSGSKDMLSDKLSHSRFADTKIGERVLGATEAEGTKRRDQAGDTTLTTSGATSASGAGNAGASSTNPY
jgi:hypothetical protein